MNYWHIQMNQPWGRDGGKIDSTELLNHTDAIIGTGNWDDVQCRYFTGNDDRGLQIGSIVLIREGNNPIAICQVTSDCFQDDKLAELFHHENYRYVDVLGWLTGNEKFPQAQGTLQRLTGDNTDSWKLIDKWYKEILEKQNMDKYLTLLNYSYNIVLTGAPGCGKTFLAKNMAKMLTGKDIDENNKQYGFVQFHPSYDYTDFVEGLRPKKVEGKDLGFELTDGIFMNFCKEAMKEDNKDKKFVFVIDEINRGEISKIFGELFFSIDPGYRGSAGKVKTQYANLREEKDQYFYVPDNVYIIGTMNDIDRSVESFDFAMRRRFTWLEITAEERISMWDDVEKGIPNWKEKAKKKMQNLNSKIEKIQGLSKAYHIGPAYFLKLRGYNGDFKKLLNNHLCPLLKEYLRGMPESDTKLDELQTAYDNE